MTEENYYPNLPEGVLFDLEIVLRNAQADPEYLLNAPYHLGEIEVLARLAGEVADLEDLEEIEGETKWDRLQRESDALFRGLTEAGKNLQSKDNSEKMAYFRTATSLLDKIVSIQERAANLAQIHKFHSTVINIMEDTLEAGQRTEVMERLKEALSNE